MGNLIISTEETNWCRFLSTNTIMDSEEGVDWKLKPSQIHPKNLDPFPLWFLSLFLGDAVVNKKTCILIPNYMCYVFGSSWLVGASFSLWLI